MFPIIIIIIIIFIFNNNNNYNVSDIIPGLGDIGSGGNSNNSSSSDITSVANVLGTTVDNINTCIASESGFNTTALNKASGAVGLIQWIPSTLAGLGYTSSQVLAMTYNQQVDLIGVYLQPFSGAISSCLDCYKAIFYPISVGRSINGMLSQNITNANPSLQDSNGNITDASLTAHLQSVASSYGLNPTF